MSMRVSIQVMMDLPEGATEDDATAYVLAAVTEWRGNLEPPGGSGLKSPGDPMWFLQSETIRVSRAMRVRHDR
jgi:hypothetical protein